jgi:hypothetical protein
MDRINLLREGIVSGITTAGKRVSMNRGAVFPQASTRVETRGWPRDVIRLMTNAKGYSGQRLIIYGNGSFLNLKMFSLPSLAE